MAINPETQYPGKIAPSSPDYPYGAARNITVPGDGTGTPWEAALVNDLFGFQQALLSEAGIVPTGSPDTATASQYLTSLKRMLQDVNGWGADKTGVSDSTAAFDAMAADLGFVRVTTPGTYLIQSSKTFAYPIYLGAGVTLSVGALQTVQFNGKFTASRTAHFNTTDNIKFGFGAIEVCLPEWFGGSAADLGLEASAPAQQDFFNAAFASLTVQNQVKCPVFMGPGAWYFSGEVNVPVYGKLMGNGDSSIAHVKDAVGAFDLFGVSDAGSNSVQFEDFAIFGNKDGAVGVVNGIVFKQPGTAIYNRIRKLYIKEMTGRGLVASSKLENSSIEQGMIRDCELGDVLISASSQLDFRGGTYRSAKNGNAGILIDSAANIDINFYGVRVQDNTGWGIFVSNASGQVHFDDDCVIRGNGINSGGNAFIDRCDDLEFRGKTIASVNGPGLKCEQIDNCTIDVRTTANAEQGAILNICKNNSIKIHAFGNGVSAANTYDGVLLDNDCDDNKLEVFARSNANQRYGLNIGSASCDNNFVVGSDLKNGGVTAGFNDAGTGTVTASANRLV